MKAIQPQINIAVVLLKQAATFEEIKRQIGPNPAVIAFSWCSRLDNLVITSGRHLEIQ